MGVLMLFLLATLSAVVHGSLPEEKLSVPEIIRYWGYPAEIHEAKTDDGYYLTLHRIPYGKNNRDNSRDNNAFKKPKKPVIFLQHGLLCSSSNWVINTPTQSLGFMLADAGFDVWLGNIRGNTYSKGHQSYKPDSKEFWDFSFDEMAKYDLPAMIDYALEHSGQKQLYYVGHSQGTMMIFAGLGENKDLQDKIKLAFALAPVARVKHIYSPIKYLSYFDGAIKMATQVLGIREFLPSAKAVKYIADKGCPLYEKLCDGVLFLISGYDKADLNKTRTPVYLTHTPAGTSMKNVLHFAQLVQGGHFQKYDYGYFGNTYMYRSWKPPKYDLSKVKIPLALISGTHDWLADPEDVAWLRSQLPQVISHQKIDKYNHLDFIWGLSARNMVYKPIIKMAKKFERLATKNKI